MQEMLEMLMKRVQVLEKKLETYYSILKFENELDFILNGTYLDPSEIENFIEGKY